MKAPSFGATLFLFSGVLGGNAFAQTVETLDVLATARGPATEAPAGFDGLSNGLVDAATHAEDLEAFEGAEDVDEGLGPLYNAQACRECHQAPISGAGSQITELRVGHLGRNGRFVDPDLPINNGEEMIRARSLAAAAESFRRLRPNERQQIVTFLNSL